MMLKRIAVLTLATLPLIAVGCSSSTKKDATATASSVASSVLASTTTTASSGGSTTTSKATSTGDVAAFCAAFTSLGAINDGSGVNNKDQVAAGIKDAAQKIRDNAPSSIAASANTYADLLDAAATSIGNANSEAAMAQALSGLGASGQNIAAVVTFAATNCPNA
jgi:hypothetical protein